MKRTVLCIFSLILILLVFGTVLSPKVQEEMMTLVEAKKTDKSSPLNTNVGEIAVAWRTSERELYTIAEGSGWETGLRIAAVPSRYYYDYDTYLAIGPYSDYRYIYSASRDPVPGGTVKAVKVRYGQDTYLLWHPETVGELDKLSNSMTLLERTDNAALIACRNSADPYFEHNMWYTFKNTVGEEVRVFSLNDVRSFCEALPWVAAVFTALLCSILLWAGTCLLSGKEGSKWVYAVNIAAIAALLGSVPLLCGCFDLPASLMPPESILDIAHYVKEFRLITDSMAAMRQTTVQTDLTEAAWLCLAIAGGALVLTAAILALEGILRKKGRG